MAERPFELDEHTDASNGLFEMSVIEAAAIKVGPPYDEFLRRSLEEGGITGLLREMLASLPEPPWWNALTLEELSDRIVGELGHPAFADSGARRYLRWSALGACWSIEFDNNHPDTLVAERLAAAAQVISPTWRYATQPSCQHG